MWVREEVKALVSLAWPSTVAFLAINLTPFFTLAFTGRLGTLELAAAGLALMFVNVTARSIVIGLALGLVPLLSHAHGAKNPTRMNAVFVRGVAVLSSLIAPLTAVWVLSDAIFVALRQAPPIAHLAGSFVRLRVITIPLFLVFSCMRQYLQAQARMKLLLAVALVVNALTLLMNFLLINALALRFTGAVLAAMIPDVASLLLLSLSLKIVPSAAPSLSLRGVWAARRECFREWREIVLHALPGCAMIVAEWWAIEILTP
jgi:multidrug resistance protein, MATE family